MNDTQSQATEFLEPRRSGNSFTVARQSNYLAAVANF